MSMRSEQSSRQPGMIIEELLNGCTASFPCLSWSVKRTGKSVFVIADLPVLNRSMMGQNCQRRKSAKACKQAQISHLQLHAKPGNKFPLTPSKKCWLSTSFDITHSRAARKPEPLLLQTNVNITAYADEAAGRNLHLVVCYQHKVKYGYTAH